MRICACVGEWVSMRMRVNVEGDGARVCKCACVSVRARVFLRVSVNDCARARVVVVFARACAFGLRSITSYMSNTTHNTRNVMDFGKYDN